MKGSTFMKWAMLLTCLFTNVLTAGAVLAESTSTEASAQDLTSLVSSNNLTSDTLSSSNLGQVSSSSGSSESTSSTSSSSTTSSESTASTSSSEDSNPSSDSGEEVSEDDSDISTRESTYASTGGAGTEADPYRVNDPTSMQAAFNKKAKYILLIGDVNFEDKNVKTKSATAKSDVVIDGAGKYRITYGTKSSATDQPRGVCYADGNISIHFKNITFGVESAYYNGEDTKANGKFGVACQGDGLDDRTLIFENVKYYSTKGAQPIHMYGYNSRVEFRGNNEFYMKGTDYETQSFAEAYDFTFADNSTTKIVDEKMGTRAMGLIWNIFGSLNFTVGKKATVDISTTHDIFNSNTSNYIGYYPYEKPDTISINDGGSLKINQDSKLASDVKGVLMISKPNTSGISDDKLQQLTINLGTSANFEINTQNPSTVATIKSYGKPSVTYTGLTVNQEKDSKATFTTAHGPFLDSKSPSAFTITDAALLSFESLDKKVSGKGPLGGDTSTFKFNQGTYDYDALTNTSKTDRNLKYLLTQQNGSNTWTVNSSGFSRKPSFTDNEASALSGSSRLVIVKSMITALSWDQDKSTSSKTETINSSSTGAGYDGKFYWTDIYPENDIKFELSMGGTSVSIPKVLNATGTQDTYELGFTIPKEYLPTSSSEPKNYTIKAYKNRGKGYVEQSSINLTINLKEDNTLELVTVPESFNWTNRLTSQSKGILSRDADNSMSFKVIASDSIKWKLTGYSQLKSGGTKRPYSFVWKDNDNSDKLLDFAGGVDVLTNETANKNGNVYEKTWANNQGVLLKSDNYLNIGDYTDYIIEWNLTRVPTF